jgi:plasmid stabilization system protein ParE
MFRLNISPDVKQEMAQAYGWYAERNEKAADDFREEVLAAFDLIARHPERFPYTVYYSVGDRVVNIPVIDHNHRLAGN